MKRIFFLFVFLSANRWVSAQVFTPTSVKAEVINDYVQIPDSAIAYPMRGLCYVTAKYSGNEIEFWILDAKGRLIYYNTHNLVQNDKKMFMDPEYVRYMRMNGQHACKSKS
jgi:hypothetical protein